MRIGYPWVPTADQKPDLQEHGCQKAGCEKSSAYRQGRCRNSRNDSTRPYSNVPIGIRTAAGLSSIISILRCSRPPPVRLRA